jgi:hypothetical protein
MKLFYKFQSSVLFVGTVFAWTTIYSDFARFYTYYHSYTRIQNCVIPNPVTTPCFYGAIAFFIAFLWSLFILKNPQSDRTLHQRKLNLLLIAGTLFAWGNFAYEAFRYYAVVNTPKVSCSGVPADNILFTSCFYGAVLFLLSLIVSFVTVRRSKDTHTK